MGTCASPGVSATADDRHRDHVIEEEIQQDRQKDVKILKLLLLGPGESGKSTVFKQVMHLHGGSVFDEEQRQTFTHIVYSNTIQAMKALCEWTEKLGECQLAPSREASKQFVMKMDGDSIVDAEAAGHIQALWEDEGILRAFDLRSRFQISDSASWFFKRISIIGEDQYMPSYEDVLYCRARTTGIVEKEFYLDGHHFRIVDVGGQRNERKKWIHCFENVTALIFVAAVNEYDQVLYEDGHTNRLKEALSLFESMANSRWFQNTAIILFLNKIDLFRDKIQRLQIPISNTFPQYGGSTEGPHAVEEALEFVSTMFLDVSPQFKPVYIHQTCATDTSNVEFTIIAVKDIVIKSRLEAVGLLE